MTGHRIAYGLILALCFVFYLAFQAWFSWVLLMAVLWLPVLSLLVSLPALWTAKVSFQAPAQVRQGVPARTALKLECKFPAPPVGCTIRLHNCLNGDRYVGQPGEYVPVENCGLVEITYGKIWIYDYLGLFRRGFPQTEPCRVWVMPRPLKDDKTARGADPAGHRWRPKAGGYSELHDLRLYRPGDDLRLIHWKMAAKTGKLIYREPLVREGECMGIGLTLSGDSAELDRKLGRLTWLAQSLLNRQLPFEIFCRTGQADLHFAVTHGEAWEQALKKILEGPPAQGEWMPEPEMAQRFYMLGGGL